MKKVIVEVCAGTRCTISGSMDIVANIENLLSTYDEEGKPMYDIEVRNVPCQHDCEKDGSLAPVVIVNGEKIVCASSDQVMNRISELRD
ncbi:hypothetical protein HCH52_02040 [Oscillospiraceae bacterium HV4-5-C5C]|nr:hypothetical protein [Oscillospiraceae bacterium HV4-5-C5C]